MGVDKRDDGSGNMVTVSEYPIDEHPTTQEQIKTIPWEFKGVVDEFLNSELLVDEEKRERDFLEFNLIRHRYTIIDNDSKLRELIWSDLKS